MEDEILMGTEGELEDGQLEEGGEFEPVPEPEDPTGGLVDPQEQQIPNDVWKTSRLRAEREAQESAQKRVDAFYQQQYAGQVDPYTGEPIQSEADYLAYQVAYEADLQRQELDRVGLDPKIIEQMIDSHPAVMQAKQYAQMQAAQAGEAALNDKISEIGQLNPEIKTVADLLKMPNVQQFNDLVTRGYDLVDAYKLVNFSNITGTTANQAVQDTMRRIQGNAMASPGALGTNHVPQQKDFSNMSDEEFEKYIQAGVRGELKGR